MRYLSRQTLWDSASNNVPCDVLRVPGRKGFGLPIRLIYVTVCNFPTPLLIRKQTLICEIKSGLSKIMQGGLSLPLFMK